MEKGYRFRIYLTQKQEELIRKAFGYVRYVYNYYLNMSQTYSRKMNTAFGYKKCSDCEKQRIKVDRIHEHIKNQCSDTFHKMTTELIHSNDVIRMEDLAARNKMKNHKLARTLSDAAWGEIRRQLERKSRI